MFATHAEIGAQPAVISGQSARLPDRQIRIRAWKDGGIRCRCSQCSVNRAGLASSCGTDQLGRCVMNAFGHWLLTVTGINDESGKWYAFWSGFGANFGEVTLLAGVLAAWHRVNCHAKGCWRIGRQQVAGTTLVVCRRHHPDGKPTHEHILELHRAHLDAERIRQGPARSDSGGS